MRVSEGLPRRELSQDYDNTFNAVADCRLWEACANVKVLCMVS